MNKVMAKAMPEATEDHEEALRFLQVSADFQSSQPLSRIRPLGDVFGPWDQKRIGDEKLPLGELIRENRGGGGPFCDFRLLSPFGHGGISSILACRGPAPGPGAA